VTAREKRQGTGIGNPAREDGTGECDRIEGREKQQDVGRPALTAPGERACEDEVPPIRLVGPVVVAGPLGEHGGERGGGPDVPRMYKSINDFPIREVVVRHASRNPVKSTARP